MEGTLDEIAEGKKDWQKVLHDFYYPFIESIESGKKNIKSQKVVTPVGRDCPECGEPLVERMGRYGKFVSCSGFPKCKFIEKTKSDRPAPVKIGIECPKCGKDIVERVGRKGKFYGCTGYPKCRFTSADLPIKETCPKCGYHLMAQKEDGTKYCLECEVKKPKAKSTKPKAKGKTK
jgi:DNA topoisomerase-1